VLVASNERNQICGWLVVEKRISLEAGFKAEITGLVVSEQCRRFGVGKKLVQAAIDWANGSKLQRMVVRSNIQREESHEFYQNMGFAFKKSAHNYELKLGH
jgi:GNAT superfamily N-acetyltransferase